MTDISKQLEQWGRWARSDIDGLGYRSAWELVMRDNVQVCRGIGYDITDDYAGQIDAAVTRLAAKKGVVIWNIVILYYLCGLSIPQIRYALRKIDGNINKGKLFSVSTIGSKLKEGESFIDGLLDNACFRKEK